MKKTSVSSEESVEAEELSLIVALDELLLWSAVRVVSNVDLLVMERTVSAEEVLEEVGELRVARDSSEMSES